jgi:membrane-associated protein
MLSMSSIISISGGLGYLLPGMIGLESMGIPSPGETALVLGGVLAGQGRLNIWIVITIAIASAIAGDNVGYWLGRRFGRAAIVAPGPFRRRRSGLLAEGDAYFARHGGKTVFIGRWVAVIRVATAWLAGINRMRFRTFLTWNALGAVSWGLTYALAGYLGGAAASAAIGNLAVGAALALGVASTGVVILIKVRRRRLQPVQTLD